MEETKTVYVPNGIFCIGQHFAVWYDAIKKGSMPEFAAPCKGCKGQEYCHAHHYPWMDMVLPVLKKQGVSINVGDDREL